MRWSWFMWSCEEVEHECSHCTHTLKKKQKKKNTQKTKELECVRIQLRLGFDSFKRFVCSKAMAAALHFCWEKIALKTKDLCVVLVGDGRWGFFLFFLCCRYLCWKHKNIVKQPLQIARSADPFSRQLFCLWNFRFLPRKKSIDPFLLTDSFVPHLQSRFQKVDTGPMKNAKDSRKL